MRQSEYTTFYERRGNVKYPVTHRGRAIYERDGVLTDSISGLRFDTKLADGEDALRKEIDDNWPRMHRHLRTQPRLLWRSKAGGVVTVNGKVIATKEDTRHDTRHGQRN